MVEAVPVPRQFFPVEEHHEVRKNRILIDAAAADLAHEVHAHGIAAEREKRAVAEREHAAIAPDEVEREREQGIAKIFSEQRHHIVGEMKWRTVGHDQIEERYDDDQKQRAERQCGQSDGGSRQGSAEREIAGHNALAFHRAALQGEQAARTALDKDDNENEDENLPDDRARPRLEKLGRNAKAQRTDQRAPERADAAKHDDHEAIDDIDLSEIGTDIADLG